MYNHQAVCIDIIKKMKPRLKLLWSPFLFHTHLVDICRSTHFKSVTIESVDGRRLSALVFVIWRYNICAKMYKLFYISVEHQTHNVKKPTYLISLRDC